MKNFLAGVFRKKDGPPVGLQEWIYKLEEGEGARYLRIALFGLALIALAALWHVREAKNFYSIEAMDSAQIARNLANGEGYSTKFVRPLSIALIEEHRGRISPELLTRPHPDIANAPVYPTLLAGLMKVVPIKGAMTEQTFSRYRAEWLIGAFNQLLFFVVLFLVYRLAARLFDRSVGVLAAALMALTELYWEFTTSGLSTMLLIALFVLLANVMVKFEMGARELGKSKGWLFKMAAFAGIIVGLMALTRYSMGWLIIPVVAFLTAVAATPAPAPAPGTEAQPPSGPRAGVALIASLLFALVLAPWLLRNFQVSGTLFGTASYAVHHQSVQYPGNVLERSMPQKVRSAVNRVEFDEYIRKLVVNTREIIVQELPRAAGNWIGAFFVAALFMPFRNVAISRLKWFLFGTLFLFIAVQALGRTELSAATPTVNSENLLVVFTPLFFIFGAGVFFTLLDGLNFPAPVLRSSAIAGFLLLMSLPLALRLAPPRNVPFEYPPYFPPYIQTVSQFMERDELMMSDMPWAVAWYGDRQCVWITLDAGLDKRDDFYRINDERKVIRGLYLTPITTNRRFLSEMNENSRAKHTREGLWANFYLDVFKFQNVPTGFPVKMAPPGMLPDQLFLSDRIRWR